MNDPYHPLNDIWSIYNESMVAALDEGMMDNPEDAQEYVWPPDLNFGDFEQSDVQDYVQERVTEILDHVQHTNGVNPNVLAGYIFRSVLCGMLWQTERYGR
jgi:hypothetical protein